jgi:thiol:disulfide interchange protein DsbD
LALALKFLSKADLVSKTFLLKRELFIGIWIIIAIGFLFIWKNQISTR